MNIRFDFEKSSLCFDQPVSIIRCSSFQDVPLAFKKSKTRWLENSMLPDSFHTSWAMPLRKRFLPTVWTAFLSSMWDVTKNLIRIKTCLPATITRAQSKICDGIFPGINILSISISFVRTCRQAMHNQIHLLFENSFRFQRSTRLICINDCSLFSPCPMPLVSRPTNTALCRFRRNYFYIRKAVKSYRNPWKERGREVKTFFRRHSGQI